MMKQRMGKGKKEADDSDEIPLKHFDEQVTEIKDILSEISALNHTNDVQQDSVKKMPGNQMPRNQNRRNKKLLIKTQVNRMQLNKLPINLPMKTERERENSNRKIEKANGTAESAVRERKSSESKDDVTKKGFGFRQF